jgi:hypothetical protein
MNLLRNCQAPDKANLVGAGWITAQPRFVTAPQISHSFPLTRYSPIFLRLWIVHTGRQTPSSREGTKNYLMKTWKEGRTDAMAPRPIRHVPKAEFPLTRLGSLLCEVSIISRTYRQSTDVNMAVKYQRHLKHTLLICFNKSCFWICLMVNWPWNNNNKILNSPATLKMDKDKKNVSSDYLVTDKSWRNGIIAFLFETKCR